MADLTTLEEKLAEVTGLAGAAQETTKKVESMLDGSALTLTETLQQMREEAEETESRCVELAGRREGKKTAILEKAQKRKARPIQERHLTTVRDGSLELAAAEDPAS